MIEVSTTEVVIAVAIASLLLGLLLGKRLAEWLEWRARQVTGPLMCSECKAVACVKADARTWRCYACLVEYEHAATGPGDIRDDGEADADDFADKVAKKWGDSDD